jgi:hypothetical protein
MAMERKTKLSRVLALVGTIMVWLPIAATLLTSLVGSIQSRRFLMDYLMPAELFLLVLIGGGLLAWSAFRVNALKLPILITLGIGIVMLIGSQGLATQTGLADGRIGMDSNWFIFVAVMLGIYTLTVIVLGIFGIRLLMKIGALNRSKNEQTD